MKRAAIEKIERKAEMLLKQYDEYKSPVDVHALAKKMGIAIQIKPELDNDLSGALIIENGVGVIGVNEKDGHLRRRYTIGHELGHFTIHYKESSTFLDEKIYIYNRNFESNLEEVEANMFAAGLLMPRTLVKNAMDMRYGGNITEFDVAELADTFQVSQIAMSYRLINLGYL